MKPTNIDQVIEKLESIIEWSKENSSRVGFFASLYLRVTLTIKSKLGKGFFDNDERLERLDVIFANRYFDAYEQYRNNDPNIPKAWAVAFDAVSNDDLIIVQHLLLGISAHINIDLGVAAARTSPGSKIDGLKGDFQKVNDVLATLVPTGLNEISELSPLLHLLEDVAKEGEEAIINFSIKVARDFSWMLATELAPLSIPEQQPIIEQKNVFVAELGEKLVNPGFLIESVIRTIHAVEVKDVVRIINTLNAGNKLMEFIEEGESIILSPEELKKAPNHLYFHKTNGSWSGRLDFKIKSWAGLFGASIGLKNLILIGKLRAFQFLFGKPSITISNVFDPKKGKAGMVKSNIKINKGWLTLAKIEQEQIVSPDGRSAAVDSKVGYGLLPFLFNEHDAYAGAMYDDGNRAIYQISMLGSEFIGNYSLENSNERFIRSVENEWLKAEEVLEKV